MERLLGGSEILFPKMQNNLKNHQNMTQTTQFTPTLMQKLLGRQYKWWYILVFYFKVGTAYRGSTIFYMVGRFLVLGLTMFIWYLNIRAGSSLTTFENIFTYYIIGSLFAWESGLNWNLAQSIMNGKISTKLLAPLSLFKIVLLQDFGWWSFSNIFQSVLLILFAIIGRDYLILSHPYHILFYGFLSIIGKIMLMFFGIIIGCAAFFFTDVQGAIGVQNDLNFYLSGKAIPLDISNFLTPITFLPFALTFYFPIQIYLGKFSIIQSVLICVLGIAWCIVLYFLAKFIFKLGLKRNEAVGL
jgi:ABC-2 type transport system permease protein